LDRSDKAVVHALHTRTKKVVLHFRLSFVLLSRSGVSLTTKLFDPYRRALVAVSQL
jgi:hypothetical protein